MIFVFDFKRLFEDGEVGVYGLYPAWGTVTKRLNAIASNLFVNCRTGHPVLLSQMEVIVVDPDSQCELPTAKAGWLPGSTSAAIRRWSYILSPGVTSRGSHGRLVQWQHGYPGHGRCHTCILISNICSVNPWLTSSSPLYPTVETGGFYGAFHKPWLVVRLRFACLVNSVDHESSGSSATATHPEAVQLHQEHESVIYWNLVQDWCC